MAEDIPDIEGNDLSSLIAAELASAHQFAKSELVAKRVENMEYLRGDMRDLPPPANRSSVVSMDVSDTIAWMLPGIVRVFTASDHMALYEPMRENDVEFAKQATDYVNYVFMSDNDGYRTLYNATHDALLNGNGIIYHRWDDSPKVEVSFHSRLTPPQLALLMDEEGVEIIAHSQNDEPDMISAPGPDGQMVDMPVPTFDVKVKRESARGRLDVRAVKPENFYIDADATSTEDARFIAYLHDTKTRSDLIEMGFDKDVVADLAAHSQRLDDAEGIARTDNFLNLRTNTLKSQDFIDLYECYVKADIDNDGIAEQVQVWYAGNAGGGKILKWTQWEDDVPYTDIPCYPIPHRWDADSVADRTKDIQRIKTQLLRQALDNLYASNMPMREVEAGSVQNPDILVAPKFGGLIWKKPGTAPIQPHIVPFVADKAFSAIQFMDEVVARRTGVSRQSMALDPEALQNQTATASQNQRDASYSQIELIARNMAELGWKRVFQSILRLIVKHQDRPRIIRLRDEFVEMDPRVWNANMDCTINVGLGTGSRERDMMMLQGVLQNQIALADRFQSSGATEQAINLLPKVVETMKKIAESAGLKSPDFYYPDFGEDDVQGLKQAAAQASQQPSVEQQKLQAQMQLEQQKAEAATSKEAAQMQADMATAEQQQRFEMYKFQNEMAMRQTELAQQREIELLKLGMKDMAVADGTTQPKDKLDLIAESLMASTQAVMQAMNQVQQGQQSLAQHLSAPTEIVRDPATGKAVGTRKVLN
jgi:hypothetical protein